jgi:bidirectional [NiFe] hydrogenase diaphorase subunit
MEGLTPYGACRLCVVEIGEGPQARLVTSCTYPAENGLKVRTASSRVMRARKMIIELLLASCPQSKEIQDIASQFEVRQQRFKQEYESCILCGRCVRMCK